MLKKAEKAKRREQKLSSRHNTLKKAHQKKNRSKREEFPTGQIHVLNILYVIMILIGDQYHYKGKTSQTYILSGHVL